MDDTDMRTETTTVMGTRVNGSDAAVERAPENAELAERSTSTALPARDEGAGSPSPSLRGDGSNDAAVAIELFPAREIERFRGEWREIQTRFVDDPREAVRSADQLVAEAMRSLSAALTDHRHELAGREAVDTEALRQTLRHYRTFLNRLLEV